MTRLSFRVSPFFPHGRPPRPRRSAVILVAVLAAITLLIVLGVVITLIIFGAS